MLPPDAELQKWVEENTPTLGRKVARAKAWEEYNRKKNRKTGIGYGLDESHGAGADATYLVTKTYQDATPGQEKAELDAAKPPKKGFKEYSNEK